MPITAYLSVIYLVDELSQLRPLFLCQIDRSEGPGPEVNNCSTSEPRPEACGKLVRTRDFISEMTRGRC